MLLDYDHLPGHVGIIMDGNGRWAKSKGKPRTFGHNEGLKAAKRVVKKASDLGIRYLTLFTFSTENWKRSESEVSFLMKLIAIHLHKEMEFYAANNIRVLHSGDIAGLPDNVCNEIISAVNDTAGNTGLTVNLAINYGGKDEIVRAVKKMVGDGLNVDQISEDMFYRYLDCPALPDADLIIRTGGENRSSNFMLWRSAYAEFYSDDSFWPDWDGDHLLAALINFQKRERKYGGVLS